MGEVRAGSHRRQPRRRRPGTSRVRATRAPTIRRPSTGIRPHRDHRRHVLSNLDISGPITIAASGVRITQSRIRGSGSYGVLVRSGSVVIEDTEISGFENGIAGDNWSAYRVDIHSTYGDGVKLGSQVLLQDSWIHDLDGGPGRPRRWWPDAKRRRQSRCTAQHHRHVEKRSRECGAVPGTDLGPSTNGPVTIPDNWLDGGNYILFCVDGNNGQFFVRAITIANNKFGRSYAYGPARLNVTGHPVRERLGGHRPGR